MSCDVPGADVLCQGHRHRDTVKTWKSAGRGLSVTCSEGTEENRESLRGCVVMGEGGAVRLKSNRDDPSGGRQDSPMDGLSYSEMTKIKLGRMCLIRKVGKPEEEWLDIRKGMGKVERTNCPKPLAETK